MRRLFSVVAVLSVAFASRAGQAIAAPNSVNVFHFKGRAASAVLTDCAFGSAVGTECRAISVFAFEQRINDDGERFGGPGVNVTLFRIVITDVAPGYVATPIGSGFTDIASVDVKANLAGGSASATDVRLCDFFPCEPGALANISLSVQWTGYGATSKFKAHDKFNDGFCTGNFHNAGTFTFAHATGVVNGVIFVEPVIIGFPATLQTDKSGSVVRCQPL